MNKMLQQFNKIILSIIYLFFFTNHSFALELKDIEPPFVSGPSGYYKDTASVKEFDTFENNLLNNLTCEKFRPCDDSVPGFKKGKFYAEGKVTKITYRNDKSPSSDLAILRSYENIFKEIGGKKISSKSDNKETIFYIEKNGQKNWMVLETYGPLVILQFLQEKSMKQLVTASAMAEDINKQGFVTLNVNFDNKKAVIKDADKPTINEVVTLLKNDAKLKLSVEGHTDNVGSATANKTLSQNRADSLVAYMVAAGISANRLVAKGFGSEVSIADNRTEDGKAKNRRVELVKIK